MGKKSKEISKLKVDKLLKLLNAALAEEWLAYYQYWIAKWNTECDCIFFQCGSTG
ncbi:MAG: hypothetical protein RSF75_07575 [Acidaminococcaceae bacterium]